MNEKFLKEYIKNYSVSPIIRQTNLAFSKLKSLKTKKGKDDYVILLYTWYIQIIENFIIFWLVNLHKDSLENLFALHQKLRENYTELFHIQENKISLQGKIFIEDIVIQILPKNVDKNVVHTYKKFIIESLEDYLVDKDFLNSYKHGLRISSNGRSTTTMSLDWWWGKWFIIGDHDTSLSYYTKKDAWIYKNDISFNYEYILAKIAFLENLLENFKKHQLSEWRNIVVEYARITDDSILAQYGILRWKSQIFRKT